MSSMSFAIFSEISEEILSGLDRIISIVISGDLLFVRTSSERCFRTINVNVIMSISEASGLVSKHWIHGGPVHTIYLKRCKIKGTYCIRRINIAIPCSNAISSWSTVPFCKCCLPFSFVGVDYKRCMWDFIGKWYLLKTLKPALHPSFLARRPGSHSYCFRLGHIAFFC